MLQDERSWMLALTQAAAFLNANIPELNWCGFYLWDENRQELVLGPFQGLPACTRIPKGKGVCGTAVAQGRSLAVADVDAFAGHIACDSASRSELVIPLFLNNKLWGVLDLDSPRRGRFQEGPESQEIEKMVAQAFAFSKLDGAQLAGLLSQLYPR